MRLFALLNHHFEFETETNERLACLFYDFESYDCFNLSKHIVHLTTYYYCSNSTPIHIIRIKDKVKLTYNFEFPLSLNSFQKSQEIVQMRFLMRNSIDLQKYT